MSMIQFLTAIAATPLPNFTITGAQDWPMFLAMLKFVGLVMAVAWGSIIGLVLYIWNDLKSTIAFNRKSDGAACTDCKKKIWEHISGPVWAAIEGCCPRLSALDKIKLRDEIKRHTSDA